MDGLEVLDRLKRDPETRHVPVHIISGVEQKREGLQAAATTSQQNVSMKKEVGEMAERTWKSWAEVVAEKAEQKAELRHARSILLKLLGQVGKNVPESLVAEIQACDDLDRLQAAVRRTRTLTMLDQFHL